MFYIVLAQTNKQNKIRETAMRKNTNQTMLFKEISGKKVEVDFNGGEVSSDAGLLFLRETDSQIGIINKVANAIHDKRHPSYVKHQIVQLLTQRVFQIASGYEDANDSNDLKNDPILKISCEKDDTLASQPTMCRFENAPSRMVLYRIAKVLVDVFIDSYDRPPQSIILDIDDTDDPTYGNQQLSLFNAYHDCYCYMPLHIYEGKSGKLITTILRPGKRASGKEIVSILKRIIKKISKAWPGVGIIIRGDSYYSSPAVYDFCRENNIKYVLGFKSYKPVLQRAHGLINKARELYEISKTPIKLYGEFSYQAGSWSEPNRVIFKAEYNQEGSNTRFIVTNLVHANRKFIYQTVYCGRGAMELMIKEHKNHLTSDRTSCSSFQANQFRLFLHSIAYILMHTFREKHLNNTEFAKAQFNTIRLKLLKIGARVKRLSTKIKIHLPSSYPQKEDFRKIWMSCCSPGYS
jgi:hypothetical protein